MVGSSFPYSEWLPEPGQARGVQIDIDGTMIGIRYPMEVNLIGDAKETLQALIPHLRRKEASSWQEGIEQDVQRWWGILAVRALEDAEPRGPRGGGRERAARRPGGGGATGGAGAAAD